MSTRPEIIALTNKQTSLKTPNAFRYAVTLGKYNTYKSEDILIR